MKDGWWSIPSIIDVTNTNFVWIPVLHGEVLAVVWKGTIFGGFARWAQKTSYK